jgi:predicted Rossmann fold flavoprotein
MVERWQPCKAINIRHFANHPHGNCAESYEIDTDRGTVSCGAIVVASGGLSIPKIGATDLGYRIAKQFDLPMVPTRPALVPLTFEESAWAPFAGLSGLSLPVQIGTGTKKESIEFLEDLLFTHRGLSGPGVLQISSYWKEGTPIRLDLLPGTDMAAQLQSAKATSKKRIANELSSLLPARLADLWTSRGGTLGHDWARPVNEASDKALQALAQQLNRWEITPNGTEGYRKAEVTAGGVDTKALSSQTMESRQRGLYFIGEVVDVTGWLGGYNFQWAWSSAFACAQGLKARLKTL